MLNMADSTCKIVSLRALDENIKAFLSLNLITFEQTKIFLKVDQQKFQLC